MVEERVRMFVTYLSLWKNPPILPIPPSRHSIRLLIVPPYGTHINSVSSVRVRPRKWAALRQRESWKLVEVMHNGDILKSVVFFVDSIFRFHFNFLWWVFGAHDLIYWTRCNIVVEVVFTTKCLCWVYYSFINVMYSHQNNIHSSLFWHHCSGPYKKQCSLYEILINFLIQWLETIRDKISVFESLKYKNWITVKIFVNNWVSSMYLLPLIVCYLYTSRWLNLLPILNFKNMRLSSQKKPSHPNHVQNTS